MKLSLFTTLALSIAALAAPPRYDHVVVVVEENRTYGQIIGDLTNAPYITSLANAGVSFNNMFALTHPSQPNYIHLFSGSAQGIVDDALITTYPFTAANLGAELVTAGFTFAGYSEQLEAADLIVPTPPTYEDYDPHSATEPNVHYRRKHNPWANWVSRIVPVPANQLSPTTNKAFTQFPTDFTLLPTVSFIVPNQLNDMHDGSRKAGDDWLLANLSAYANWAKTHNSLLVITWDEDDYNLINRVPTVFYGANLKNGRTVAPTWTLHNLLRTIEDMYGTTHAGRAGQVKAITGMFAGEPTPVVATFRQGLNGYTSCKDTFITSDQPTTSFAATHDLSVDGDYGAAAGNQPAQGLVRFDNLFGAGIGQVPPTAIILSAKLIIETGPGANDDTNDRIAVHRMIMDWTDTATWDSLVAGVVTDNVDARSTASFTHYPNVEDIPAIFDVSADVEAWRTGTANRGWLLKPDTSGGTDGWLFKSAETSSDVTIRPTLEIAYTLPATPFQTWGTEATLTAGQIGATLDVDGDGSNNVIEFGFNMNPLTPDAPLTATTGTAGMPLVRATGAGATRRLQLEFIRRKTAVGSGLTYEAQFAADVSTFAAATVTDSVTSIDATWERVLISDPVAGAGQRFARVKLTLAP